MGKKKRKVRYPDGPARLLALRDKLVEAPDLMIFEEAKYELVVGGTCYSCIALSRAISRRFMHEFMQPWRHGLTQGDINLASHKVKSVYSEQYKKACMVDGHIPYWWSSGNRHLHARLTALNDMMDLCRYGVAVSRRSKL